MLRSQAVDVEGNSFQVCHIIERESATEAAITALRAAATAKRFVGFPVVGRIVNHDVSAP